MSDQRTDLPSPSAPNFNQRVREILMAYLGRQGNPLDRGVTFRDLLKIRLVKLRNGIPIRYDDTLPVESNAKPALDLTPPPTPSGFVVSAGITHIFIEHSPPIFAVGGGYLRTRVYGAIREAGAPAPVFSNATEIAQFSGQAFAYPTNPGTTWHLWIRWETKAGVLSPAPAGGTNGLVVTTGQDVTSLLKVLEGKITSNEIANAAVINSKIADAAVSTDKIADAAVVNAKIADNAISSDKIQNSAVSTLKIAANAVIIPASATGTYSAEVSVSTDVDTTFLVIGTFTQGSDKNGHEWRLAHNNVDVRQEAPISGTLGTITLLISASPGTHAFRIYCVQTSGSARCNIVVFGAKR